MTDIIHIIRVLRQSVEMSIGVDSVCDVFVDYKWFEAWLN